MGFSLSSRVLLRAVLAGAVVLTGTACSRSDRTDSARDNSAAVLPDKDAAGYRSMERDTTNVPSQHSDAARVTVDNTTASADVSADTTVAGYAEMARDTSTVADQADTAAAPNGDVALQTPIDTSAQANADVSIETGVAAADTTGNADSTEVVRIRPPEDSTEILGTVTTDEAVDETADEQVVRPEDRETVAASETPTDEVGAAAIGGNVTGADAVALISRAGVRCAVVDLEANDPLRWDMSSTPITLNPCGLGSMTLSRIWTEK